MTLTSIGYGDIVPQNTAERYLCSLYMLVSGVIWTYAIGSVASIATTLNPNGVLYHNMMDSLNYFMRERSLPAPMRITLREYFQNARRVHQVTDDSALLHRLTPLLQGTVALAANKQWLDHVWYFRSLGDSRDGREFIASIAKMLVIRAYVAHERLPIGQLYVLRRGLVVKVRPRTPACICAPADTPAHPHTRAHNRRVLTPCPLVCILSLSALCAVVALPRVRQGVGGGHGA